MALSHLHTTRLTRLAAFVASCGLAVAMPAAQAAFGTNLLVNAGADDAAGGDGSFVNNLPGWTVTGEMVAIDYALGGPQGYPSVTDPGPDDRGANHFSGGNVGSSHATQSIDLSFAQPEILGTGARYQLSGWLGGYLNQNDFATLGLSFLDANDAVIGTGSIGPVSAADRSNQTAMLYRQQGGWVPIGAVKALVDLGMTRTGGTSNDGYADSLGLSLFEGNVALDAPTVVQLGSSFEVTVSALNPFAGIYDGDEVLAFGFDLAFDTSVLSLTGVDTLTWDDDSGLVTDVDVAGSAFPGVADAGQAALDLVVLTFNVIGLGATTIDVQSDYGSNLNHGLTYFNGASVDLYGRANITATPVPVPGALWLMGGALGMLAQRRRRS